MAIKSINTANLTRIMNTTLKRTGIYLTGFFVCGFSLAMCNTSLAQATLPAEIEDPQCLGINKEPFHATLMPYASLKEALAAKRDA